MSPSSLVTSLFGFLLTAVVLLAPAPAAAQGTYIGCVPSTFTFGYMGFVPGTHNGASYWYTTETATSVQNCQDICTTDQYPYAYYTSASATQNCVCSNFAPTGGNIQPGADTHGGCETTSNYVGWRVGSTFLTPTCYVASGLTSGGDSVDTSDSTLASCFTGCSGARVLFLRWDASTSNPQCACGLAPDVEGTTTTCDVGTFFVYDHSEGGYASQLPRKRMRERLEMARREQARAICPNGLAACRVQGASSDAFECIDTNSELESCGGCTGGLFNPIESGNTTSTGQDCTRMLGAKRGATTCHRGRCEAYRCLRGYQLVGHECVPQINF